MSLNLPNILTLSRIGLALLFIILYQFNTIPSRIIAVLIVIGSIITDYWDGKLARQQGLVSDFGKLIDPLTDSILYVTIFACFSFFSKPPWMPVAFFWAVAAREFLIHSALRPFMLSKNMVVAARYPGKVKTVMQCVVAITALVFMTFVKILGYAQASFTATADLVCRIIVDIIFAIIVFVSLYSFFLYVLDSLQKLLAKNEQP
jgi:CDP-diacylglycerol--glycerol-3-phosphate 3-phosphatidyltransferase